MSAVNTGAIAKLIGSDPDDNRPPLGHVRTFRRHGRGGREYQVSRITGWSFGTEEGREYVRLPVLGARGERWVTVFDDQPVTVTSWRVLGEIRGTAGELRGVA